MRLCCKTELVEEQFLKNRNCEFQFNWALLKGITTLGIDSLAGIDSYEELIPYEELISYEELIPYEELMPYEEIKFKLINVSDLIFAFLSCN